ncbi:MULTISPECIES: hypothetical protein [unclassified Treponema]|uniref:hypothetical protein n=1 Tax=unclassified Treponema TaxID=2638727 RepID=UPI0020A564B5|nr:MULTISPECIES: hypothetical protein [unclassified Treponema]UTC66017.1 hypothetical protein E4O06_08270 [Treponema sp. OMZ 789]UTC68747.1 hypothetical protein E4O01_08410 [Treponema sp. OMZ 790]UTC71476.1 hypothetical protein E4O02_08600 [Treponema sp. OMZ 791]
MNEKIFFIFAFLLLFTGCCTRSGIHNHGNGAYEVRENIGKLGEEQTQSAVTSTELKGGIEKSLEQVGELEQAITDGAGDLEEFKAILQRIRKTGKRKDTGKTNSN